MEAELGRWAGLAEGQGPGEEGKEKEVRPEGPARVLAGDLVCGVREWGCDGLSGRRQPLRPRSLM